MQPDHYAYVKSLGRNATSPLYTCKVLLREGWEGAERSEALRSRQACAAPDSLTATAGSRHAQTIKNNTAKKNISKTENSQIFGT